MSIEFFDNMDEYFKDGKAFQKKIIKEWIERSQLDKEGLDVLFSGITELYSYQSYPNLNAIMKIWEQVKFQTFSNSSINDDIYQEKIRWLTFDVGDILRLMKAIWNKKINNCITDIEVMFYCEYEKMQSEYYFMKDSGWSPEAIQKRLNILKSCMVSGKPYFSVTEEIEIVQKPLEQIEEFAECSILENII